MYVLREYIYSLTGKALTKIMEVIEYGIFQKSYPKLGILFIERNGSTFLLKEKGRKFPWLTLNYLEVSLTCEFL